jgi:hypothetical protein
MTAVGNNATISTDLKVIVQKNNEPENVQVQTNSAKDTSNVKLPNSGHALTLEGFFDNPEKIIYKPEGKIDIENPRYDLESLINELFTGAKVVSEGVVDSSKNDPFGGVGGYGVKTTIVFEANKGRKYVLDNDYSYSGGCFGVSKTAASIRPVSESEAKQIIQENLKHPKIKTPKQDDFPNTKIELLDPKDLFPDKKNYQVQRNKDNSISVRFDMGHNPGYRNIVLDIFPDAKNISLGEIVSKHPFTSMQFEVDGQKYILSELTGGFAPSSGLTIYPIK